MLTQFPLLLIYRIAPLLPYLISMFWNTFDYKLFIKGELLVAVRGETFYYSERDTYAAQGTRATRLLAAEDHAIAVQVPGHKTNLYSFLPQNYSGSCKAKLHMHAQLVTWFWLMEGNIMSHAGPALSQTWSHFKTPRNPNTINCKLRLI